MLITARQTDCVLTASYLKSLSGCKHKHGQRNWYSCVKRSKAKGTAIKKSFIAQF